jgi:hypothetical protein
MDLSIFREFSEAEQAYATSLLDPFHDSPYRLTGAPSDQLSNSTVLTVNQELVVGAGDFGLPITSGNKWDLHVSSIPLLRSSNSYLVRHMEANRYQGSGTVSESKFEPLFPITASANTTGLTTFTDVSENLGITTDLCYFSSNSAVAWQDLRTMRVIGQSFEVVDETPQLYKQGSVTVYTRASAETKNRLIQAQLVVTGGVSVISQSQNADTFNCPPNRIQQATIIPNGKTWMAEKGAYVVAKPANTAPPFFRPGIAQYLGVNPTDNSDSLSYNCWLAREGTNSVYNPNLSAYSNDANAVLPFNTCGAYFTGLNSEFGVFRIRSKINYEIIPDPSDTALISLSTPTLPRNPKFEAILSELLSKLPAGYPQVDNPGGEVWRAIRKTAGTLRTVAKFVAPGVTMAVPESAIFFAAADKGLAMIEAKKKKAKKDAPKQLPKAKAKAKGHAFY